MFETPCVARALPLRQAHPRPKIVCSPHTPWQALSVLSIGLHRLPAAKSQRVFCAIVTAGNLPAPHPAAAVLPAVAPCLPRQGFQAAMSSMSAALKSPTVSRCNRAVWATVPAFGQYPRPAPVYRCPSSTTHEKPAETRPAPAARFDRSGSASAPAPRSRPCGPVRTAVCRLSSAPNTSAVSASTRHRNPAESHSSRLPIAQALLLSQSPAIRVSGIGRGSQLCRHTVALVRIQQVGANLGRLTKTQRQHAGRRRIQTAGMPRFLRIQQSSHHLQRPVRRHARRLVKQQQAVDRLGVGASFRVP